MLDLCLQVPLPCLLLIQVCFVLHHQSSSSWILDPGASHHMTPDSFKKWLSSIPFSIHTADGSPKLIKSDPSLLASAPNAFHVPRLSLKNFILVRLKIQVSKLNPKAIT